MAHGADGGLHSTRRGRSPGPGPTSPFPFGPGNAHIAGVWEIAVDAGPDAGRCHMLGVGRHHVGRSPACSIAVADPAIEPHHAVLDVGLDGAVVFTQLTGRWPILAGGRPMPIGVAVPGVPIDIGDSRLVLRPAGQEHDRDGALPPFAARLGWQAEPSVPDIDLDSGGLRSGSGSGSAGRDDAVVADLGGLASRVVAVRGEHAIAAVRSIVVQLARSTEPSECRLVPMLADRAEADWIARATHGGDAGLVAGRRLVVLADRVAVLRSAPVVEMIRHDAPVTVILAVAADRSVPPESTAVLHVGPRWRGCWTPDTSATGAATSTRLHVAGRSVAGALAELDVAVSRGSPARRR